MLIDSDREGNAVLMQKRSQSLWPPLRFMVLKNAVEANDIEICIAEQRVGSLGLGETVRNAGWAQHLEDFDQSDAAIAFREIRWLIAIEPLSN